tara:strand:+ start:49 stop:273 length:225 start_codon:yes stop_codon:yes gene_type:complete
MKIDEYYKEAVTGTEAGDVISDANLTEAVKKIALEFAKKIVKDYEEDSLYFGRDSYYSDIDIAQNYIDKNLSNA